MFIFFLVQSAPSLPFLVLTDKGNPRIESKEKAGAYF